MWVSCGVVQSEETNIRTVESHQAYRSARLRALLTSLVAIALLSVAMYVKPASEGVGTHQQLGLPQCGWIIAANVPCPTCGMTTAWSHTVRGEISSAFLAQPMGMLLAIATMFVATGGLFSAMTGYSFNGLLYRFAPSKIFIVVVVLTLASWGLKILLHRDLI
jgi:hypothetical protein